MDAKSWQGVNVENGKYVNRIDDLRTVPSQVRFLSLRLFLGALPNLNLEGIEGRIYWRRIRPRSASDAGKLGI